MSGKVQGAVWELELERPKKWLLLAMADNAHDDGSKCYPGVRYLAWKTGYSRRQVQRILKELCADGLLEAVAYEEGGRGYATEYTIHIEKGVKMSPLPKKGDISRRKGDIQVSPQPSVIEPSDKKLLPNGNTKEGRPSLRPSRKQTIKKLSEEEAEQRFNDFCDNNPLGDRIRELVQLAAEENTSGRITWGRAWRQFAKIVERDLDEFSLEAWGYGLDAAIEKPAPHIGYAKAAAQNYRPLAAPKTNGHKKSDNVKEDYEWLFA